MLFNFQLNQFNKRSFPAVLTWLISYLYYGFIALLLISNDNGWVNKIFYLAALLFIGGLCLAKQWPFPRQMIPLAVFILFSAATAAYSDRPDNLPRYLKHGLYILLFFMISWQMRSAILSHNRLFKLIALVCTFSALLNMALFYRLHPLSERLVPCIGATNIIDYAGFLALGAVFCCYLLYTQTAQFWRIASIIMLIILLTGIVLSQSRTPIIGLALALLALFSNNKKRLLICVALIALILMLILYLFPGITTRDAVQGAPTPRIYTWLYVLDQLEKHNLWLGFGYGHSFGHYFAPRHIVYNNPHGVFSSVLYYTGIVGLLLFGVYLLSTITSALRQIKRNSLPAALCLLAIVHSLTQGDKYIYHPIEIWILLWFPLFIAMAIIQAEHDKLNNSSAAG